MSFALLVPFYLLSVQYLFLFGRCVNSNLEKLVNSYLKNYFVKWTRLRVLTISAELLSGTHFPQSVNRLFLGLFGHAIFK